jgi:hypothetical protein
MIHLSAVRNNFRAEEHKQRTSNRGVQVLRQRLQILRVLEELFSIFV